MTYVIDTHALLWHLDGNPRLGAAAKKVLSDPGSQLVLPATAYAEACWICQNRRRVRLSLESLVARVGADPRVSVVPLTGEVIERSNSLATIAEMHDRQIVATALLMIEAGEPASLLSHDANIVQAGILPVLW